MRGSLVQEGVQNEQRAEQAEKKVWQQQEMVMQETGSLGEKTA